VSAPLVAALLAAGGLAVALAAHLFTNAIEWLGERLRLDDRVLGGVFAAWGTALPETAVPLVAALRGGDAAHAVGVGAILGAPLMLATLALALLGATVALRPEGRALGALRVRPAAAIADLVWFCALFALAAAAGTVLARSPRAWAAPALVLGYGLYAVRAWRQGGGEGGGAPMPGRFAFWAVRRPPPLTMVVGEAVVAAALLLAGAEAFVAAVTALGRHLALPPLVLALVLAPLATELPEVMNSVLWTWRGRDDLALSAVTGAMVIQSAVGPALGLLLTPWRLGPPEVGVVAGAVAGAAFVALVLARAGRLPARALWVNAGLYGAVLAALAAVR
jgi:cation:H+ antiporter